MDFQREPQSKHHLYCEQEKPAHCHGSLLLRLGTHQIQNRTRDAHKISPHGTMTGLWFSLKVHGLQIGAPNLLGHAIAYRWRSLPRVRRYRASKPQGSSKRVLPWQVTMDQLISASLSHTHTLLKVLIYHTYIHTACKTVNSFTRMATRGVQRKIRPHLDLLSIPRLWGKKMSKRSGGIKRLQIQNHFMAFKQVPRCR